MNGALRAEVIALGTRLADVVELAVPLYEDVHGLAEKLDALAPNGPPKTEAEHVATDQHTAVVVAEGSLRAAVGSLGYALENFQRLIRAEVA